MSEVSLFCLFPEPFLSLSRGELPHKITYAKGLFIDYTFVKWVLSQQLARCICLEPTR